MSETDEKGEERKREREREGERGKEREQKILCCDNVKGI
jgi:hypothetical protein